MTLRIEKFVPFRFCKRQLELTGLSALTGKNWSYSSSGKASLYHCLKSLNIQGKLLMPVYMCSSVKPVLRRLKISPIYYDLSETDLNADVEDIKKKILQHPDVSGILVAGLYGNPVDYPGIEKICKDFGIKLIDDAAQSFGAKLNGRLAGTWGDAGFFSFSPGKSTPGHLGSFFWTSNRNYSFKRKNHWGMHVLAYLNYYFNRYEIYTYKRYRIFVLFSYLYFYLQKRVDMVFDSMNRFESRILGGILYANFKQTFRCEFSQLIHKALENSHFFRIITRGAEGTNNHKIVLVARDEDVATEMVSFLTGAGIYVASGYDLMEYSADVPTAKRLYKRVLELPLENDRSKLDYTIENLRLYECSCHNNHL